MEREGESSPDPSWEDSPSSPSSSSCASQPGERGATTSTPRRIFAGLKSSRPRKIERRCTLNKRTQRDGRDSEERTTRWRKWRERAPSLLVQREWERTLEQGGSTRRRVASLLYRRFRLPCTGTNRCWIRGTRADHPTMADCRIPTVGPRSTLLRRIPLTPMDPLQTRRNRTLPSREGSARWITTARRLLHHDKRTGRVGTMERGVARLLRFRILGRVTQIMTKGWGDLLLRRRCM